MPLFSQCRLAHSVTMLVDHTASQASNARLEDENVALRAKDAEHERDIAELRGYKAAQDQLQIQQQAC